MYVTHNGVVKTGDYGFGNQMFQVAAVYGIARSNNANPVFFRYWNNMRHFSGNFPLMTPPLEPAFSIKEKSFDYNNIVLPTNKTFIDIEGYFQSHKYFESAEDEVRELFEFKKEIYQDVLNVYKAADLGTTCSISVRRGDYVRLQHIHPLQPDDYWERAQKTVEQLDTIHTYIVFSDDIEWCRRNVHLFNKTGKRVLFMQGRTQIDDFIFITLCDHNIITNSTFSWWGAYLNKNPDKIVVMPKLWFGPTGPWSGPSNGDDLHYPSWYRI